MNAGQTNPSILTQDQTLEQLIDTASSGSFIRANEDQQAFFLASRNNTFCHCRL